MQDEKIFLWNSSSVIHTYRQQRSEAVAQKCSLKKVFFKIPQNSHESGLFFNCNFIKKEIWHRCFPVNFVKFLRTPFLENNSGRLLLNVYFCKDVPWRKFQLRNNQNFGNQTQDKCFLKGVVRFPLDKESMILFCNIYLTWSDKSLIKYIKHFALFQRWHKEAPKKWLIIIFDER